MGCTSSSFLVRRLYSIIKIISQYIKEMFSEDGRREYSNDRNELNILPPLLCEMDRPRWDVIEVQARLPVTG